MVGCNSAYSILDYLHRGKRVVWLLQVSQFVDTMQMNRIRPHYAVVSSLYLYQTNILTFTCTASESTEGTLSLSLVTSCWTSSKSRHS